MSDKKETLRVAQYLVSKDGRTKYLKFSYADNAAQATKDMVEAIKTALGSDVLYINLFDSDFKEKYNVPDFVKGSVSVPLNEKPAPAPAAKPAASTTKKTAKPSTGTDW